MAKTLFQKAWDWLTIEEGARQTVSTPHTFSRKGLKGGRPTKKAGAYSTALGSLFPTADRPRTSTELLKRIRDYAPDPASAVWTMIRMATELTGIHVFYHDTNEQDAEGQRLIEALNNSTGFAIAQEYGGGFEVLASILVLSLMTQGAAALEVGLTEDLTDIIGWFPVDPDIVDWQFDKHHVPFPVIRALGKTIPINTEQFRYLPIDPEINDPKGRSPLWPSVEIVAFQMEVLRDLKAVAHNQGYPRIDVSILQEIVTNNLKQMRPDLMTPGKEDELRSWMDGYLSDLQEAYSDLNPDDAFIHWDWVQVGSGNADHRSGSISINGLIQIIDAQVVSSLKTLPILLGRNVGATTTHATVQWQIFADSVESIQSKVKMILEWAANFTLQVWGRPSYCVLSFERPRKGDRESDARAAQLETQTWITRVGAGWADHDEASIAVLGHEAAGTPRPLQAPLEEGVDTDSEPMNAEPMRMVTGDNLRGELWHQIGTDVESSEAQEWALTPLWMQARRERQLREMQVLSRLLWLQSQQALLDIPDDEWEKAMTGDSANKELSDSGG